MIILDLVVMRERLGRSANSFNELYIYLQKNPTFIDRITLQILEDKIQSVEPQLVCFFGSVSR